MTDLEKEKELEKCFENVDNHIRFYTILCVGISLLGFVVFILSMVLCGVK